jgi:type II secretory pathway component PulJ
MPTSPLPEIDDQVELLRTAVEALAADLRQLTASAGATKEITREDRARLQWRTQQVLGLTKAIARARMAWAGHEPAAHTGEFDYRVKS